MKLKRSLKNKLKKFLFMLPILLVVFSLICLPVSAVTVGGADILLVNGYYWVPGSGTSAYHDVNISNSSSNSWSASMSLINPLSTNSQWQSSAQFTFSATNNNGTLSVTIFSGGTVQRNSYNGFYSVEPDGTSDSKLPTQIMYNSDGSVTYLYEGIVPSRFIINVYSNYTGSSSTLVTEYFYFTYSPGLSSDADAIIENDIELANEQMYGWPYDGPGSLDSGDLGDLGALENDLLGDTQSQSADAIANITSNFYSSFSRLQTSFGAISGMFRSMTDFIPDLNVLIYFSLIIGVIPVIVGMGINGLRASDRASSRKRQEAAYKQGYNSGYTKGKGG